LIARLLNLELVGFRCFADKQEVPLDADVVLIHGSNGSGKTSIINAIELALTGQVSELAAFESDYPRCLRNVDTAIGGHVAIRFRTQEGKEIKSTVDVSEGAPSGGEFLSAPDLRFFRDRCYLSQTSLSRLLENYQASSTEEPEQPLVRFIRELLGLDLLENITAGLHEAANITRIEKSVPALSRLRQEDRILQEKIGALENAKTTQAIAWQQTLVAVQQLVAESGDPMPEARWTPDGVLARSKTYAQGKREEAASSLLQKLRQAEGRLNRAIGLLGTPAGTLSLESVKQQLATNLDQQTLLERTVAPILDRAEAFLKKLGMTVVHSEDLAVRSSALEAILNSLRTNRGTETEVLSHSQKELLELQNRAAVLEKTVATLAPDVSSQRAESTSLASLLGTVLEHLKSDDCPVCDRDYSELGIGDLRTLVLRKIETLGADANRLQSIARQRDEATAEYDSLKSRIAALVDRLRIDRERIQSQSAHEDELREVASEVLSLSELWMRWRETRTATATLAAQLQASEIRETERHQAAIEIAQVAALIDSTQDVQSADPRTVATSLIDVARKRAGVLEKQAAGMTRLRESLERAAAAGFAWQQAEQEFTTASKRIAEIQRALSQVEHDLESARHLSRAATRAKTRTLDQVFNEKLNRLWRDLFRRLVKFERFEPHLKDPKTVRGQIRTSIGAWHEGKDPFEQFAAVASSGNLNTAALSLFLSLHLIEEARHCLLILDDPIQNMDDLHVVQLANLLREIRQKARRQLILAVHERALFDYLCLELGPTTSEANLLTVELACGSSGKELTIHSTLREWKPDMVRFGTGPIAAS
jgi:exonuclease SbcC